MVFLVESVWTHRLAPNAFRGPIGLPRTHSVAPSACPERIPWLHRLARNAFRGPIGLPRTHSLDPSACPKRIPWTHRLAPNAFRGSIVKYRHSPGATVQNRSSTGESRGYVGSPPWHTVAKPGVTVSSPWTQPMSFFSTVLHGGETNHAEKATIMPRNKPASFRTLVLSGCLKNYDHWDPVYPDSMRRLP